MDQHTINRLGQVRQQEILQSAAAQGEVELQPWLKSVSNTLGIVWRQTNDLAERIEVAANRPQPSTGCPPIERSGSRS